MGRLAPSLLLAVWVAAPTASCFADPSLTSGGSDASTDQSPSDVVSEPLPTIDAPSCGGGGVCVDSVPSGWTGPLALFDSTGGPPAPQPAACPATYPTDVFDGNASLSAPAATCACTCGSVTGATCGASTLQVYTGSNCGSTNCFNATVTSCTSLACNTGNSAKITPPAPVGGTCTAQPTKTVPALGWSRTGRACQTTSTSSGCAGSSVCVPLPPAPFAQTVCILQQGDVACPAGIYGQKLLYYTGATDTRSCSTCGCDPATGVTCSGGQMTLWDASGCSGSKIGLAIDGTCRSANGITTVSANQTIAPTPSGGSCNASSGSGKPTGSVTPTGPTTVCCAQ